MTGQRLRKSWNERNGTRQTFDAGPHRAEGTARSSAMKAREYGVRTVEAVGDFQVGAREWRENMETSRSATPPFRSCGASTTASGTKCAMLLSNRSAL